MLPVNNIIKDKRLINSLCRVLLSVRQNKQVNLTFIQINETIMQIKLQEKNVRAYIKRSSAS